MRYPHLVLRGNLYYFQCRVPSDIKINFEVTIVRDNQNDHAEDGVDVPFDRINPETLRKMVEEFVTREWSDLADSDYTFEDKVEQVLQQLKGNKIKVVFDLTSETCNIVSCR